MLTWETVPREVANLLNPAFCSILISESVAGFCQDNRSGMPYPLAFLILPIVLHKRTRENLPTTIRTKLHSWLQQRSDVRIGFKDRVALLRPYTKEALLFSVKKGSISFEPDGNLHAQLSLPEIAHWGDNTEAVICRKKACFLGHWFAQSGQVPTIFAMWGIRP